MATSGQLPAHENSAAGRHGPQVGPCRAPLRGRTRCEDAARARHPLLAVNGRARKAGAGQERCSSRVPGPAPDRRRGSRVVRALCAHRRAPGPDGLSLPTHQVPVRSPDP